MSRARWQVPRWLVYFLYNCLYPMLLIILLPGQVGKMRRRGGYAVHFGQRFGRFEPDFLDFVGARVGGGIVWIHAVSVGEMNQALRFAATLRDEGAWEGGIVLSTTTSTGRRLAEESCDPGTWVIWLPFDFPWVMRRVLGVFEPRMIVLIEAEVWPNMLAAARRAGVPVYLANARLSPRSARRYGWFRPFVAPLFSLLEGVGVADEADRKHWLAMGLADDRIHTTGAIKFDLPLVEGMPGVEGVAAVWKGLVGWDSGPVLLAASTHAGEEALIAGVGRSLRGTFPELKMIVIPRHFERAAEVAVDLRRCGWTVVMRSGVKRGVASVGDALLVDTTGELRAWLVHADVVVVGKSFAGQVGGQNPAEPVQAGIPTIVGPRMDNFASLVAGLLGVEGIRQVGGDGELEAGLREILMDPEKGRAMAGRGRNVLNRHRGASVRTLAMISTSLVR